MAGVWDCHFAPHHKKAPAERGSDVTHSFIFCLFFRFLGVVKWLRCGGKCSFLKVALDCVCASLAGHLVLMLTRSMRKGFADQISNVNRTTGETVYLPENKLFSSTSVAPLTYNFNVLMASGYY